MYIGRQFPFSRRWPEDLLEPLPPREPDSPQSFIPLVSCGFYSTRTRRWSTLNRGRLGKECFISSKDFSSWWRDSLGRDSSYPFPSFPSSLPPFPPQSFGPSQDCPCVREFVRVEKTVWSVKGVGVHHECHVTTPRSCGKRQRAWPVYSFVSESLQFLELVYSEDVVHCQENNTEYTERGTEEESVVLPPTFGWRPVTPTTHRPPTSSTHIWHVRRRP